jgi:2-oxoisovalerate dehydrogenase E2 component (dihydrolipoyl transacylase)
MGRYVFRLPDVGEGTAEAEVVNWHVKPGDTVAEDQPIVDVMTDKATVEITSPVDGLVASIHGEPGQMAAVGSTLVVFEVEGAGNNRDADIPAPAAAPEPAAAQAKPVIEVEAAEEAKTPEPDMGQQGNYVFKLPDVGEGTAEAELVEWKVAVGQHVEEDQPLADVMTDKATVELTSPVAGRVSALNGEPGKLVAVGSALVILEVEGAGNRPSGAAATAPAPKAETKPAPARAEPSAPPAKAKAAAALSSPAPSKSNVSLQPGFATRTAGERPLASPAVRKRARELGIELQFVAGSGPAGRIQHEDLDAFVAAGGRSAGGGGGVGPRHAPRTGTSEVKIIGLRRKIAEKMQESKRRIPHITYVEEVDATELEALRVHLNATKRADQPKLTLLPFFVRALVKVLPEHPQINARFDDDAGVLHQSEGVHVGIATQGPNGLMVPVVRHAEALDVWDVAREIARVSGAARDGSATREELTGSTITITSLGTLGGVVHTPVINHPEVAIVGPNKIMERPVVRHGQVVVRKMMNISSSFDHRIVDGWDAATFIQKIKGLLEHPATLFMD